MHLTFSHPEVVGLLPGFGYGIWTPNVAGKYCLIIKASKEVILTAKVNKGFHFYLVPTEIGSQNSVAIITAFFDNPSEPLTITTPIAHNDQSTQDFLEFLKQDDFEVFFFDENNRELLSYRAKGNLNAMRQKIIAATLLGTESMQQMIDAAQQRFSLRTPKDNEEAFSIQLTESLFPDEFVIFDLDLEKHSFIGTKTFSANSLERLEPGTFQELDIVLLLQKTFEPKQIYLNPVKEADKKEFVDILVVGETAVLLIQAKDSPNTEHILNNTVDRKRRKSIAQVKEAANQLIGAIAFAKKERLLHFIFDESKVNVDIAEKQLIGIIVVKELFDDSFDKYSAIAYDLFNTANVPAVFFDYSDLNMMTFHCTNENKFLRAIHQILSLAAKNGQFPRLRFLGRPE